MESELLTARAGPGYSSESLCVSGKGIRTGTSPRAPGR